MRVALSSLGFLVFLGQLGCASNGPIEGADVGRVRDEGQAAELDGSGQALPDTLDVDEDAAAASGSDDATPMPDTAAVDAELDVDGSGGAPDVPGLPEVDVVMPGAEALREAFAGAARGSGAGPRVVYPESGTRMPLNVAPATIQWDGSGGTRGYRLTATTAERRWSIYTTDWSWTPERLNWERLISDSRRSGVEFAVEALDGSGRIVGGEEGDGVLLSFSAANVDGAVYYWTPDQSGITRLEVGAEAPEPFLTATVFNCVGCHALSPDGSRLAYTRSGGGTPIGTLGVVATDDDRTQLVAEGRHALYYPSFSPDNVRLAAGSAGNVVVLNTDTGEIEDTLPKPEGTGANFPAWSPLDDAVVYAAGPSGGMDSLGVSNSGLVRVRRTARGWSEPEWLVERGAAGGLPESLYYPAYAPTGRWIVFNRSRTGAAVGGSPEDSELWLVSAGGGTALRLDRANGRSGATNSWPRWAPASGDGTLWIAFTSNRTYGRMGGGHPQIWIAAVDPRTAAPGFDPSAPAYWMPGQDLGASNHVAYWAEYEKE